MIEKTKFNLKNKNFTINSNLQNSAVSKISKCLLKLSEKLIEYKNYFQTFHHSVKLKIQNFFLKNTVFNKIKIFFHEQGLFCAAMFLFGINIFLSCNLASLERVILISAIFIIFYMCKTNLFYSWIFFIYFTPLALLVHSDISFVFFYLGGAFILFGVFFFRSNFYKPFFFFNLFLLSFAILIFKFFLLKEYIKLGNSDAFPFTFDLNQTKISLQLSIQDFSDSCLEGQYKIGLNKEGYRKEVLNLTAKESSFSVQLIASLLWICIFCDSIPFINLIIIIH